MNNEDVKNQEQEGQDNENHITDPKLIEIWGGLRKGVWKKEDGTPCSMNQACFNVFSILDVLAHKKELADAVAKELTNPSSGVDGNLSEEELAQLNEEMSKNNSNNLQQEENQEENGEDIIESIKKVIPSATEESLIEFFNTGNKEKLSDEQFLKEYADFLNKKQGNNEDEIEKAAMVVKATSNSKKTAKKDDKPAFDQKAWLKKVFD